MIQEFVNRWEKNKHLIKTEFEKTHPQEYKDIVKLVVKNLQGEDEYSCDALDFERIHEINDGNYHGTLLYIIGVKGYSPSAYYSVYINYGSCSVCDTLSSIHCYETDEVPTKDQVEQYMTLALHIVQGLKVVGEPS